MIGILCFSHERRQMRGMKSGVGGWLLVFCLLLLVWQPISFGLIASRVLDRVSIRGMSLVFAIVARLIVTALGISAGLALLNRRPGAVRLAMVSLGLTAATDLFIYATPFFPNNRAPGETPLYVIASLAYSGAWMLYLLRSK